ncbi:cell division protein FtsA [Escherichia coli]|nr:cell division protein FtsA [Escherichia coli]
MWKTSSIPRNRWRVRDEHRVLHVIPQEYAIDYQEGIKNPVGLSGVRMQAKVHLITCHNDMAKNIVKAVERCGLKVDQTDICRTGIKLFGIDGR